MDIEQQYDKLLRYCYQKVKNRTLAEDITQETFLRFFESKDYRDIGREMAYLYTIARNLCMDYFRRPTEEALEDSDGPVKEFPGADGEERFVDRVAIENAMARLDEEEREAIALRVLAELPVTDIGKSMGLSRFAVRRRLSSAMEKLRKELENDES